jgi:predicted RNA-binding protein with PIN domain
VYLVDGNNVMGQRVGWHRDRRGARRRLLKELSDLQSREGFTITVVFDGPAPEDISDGHLLDGVRVFFAGPRSSADDRIVDLAREASHRESLLGVTSDRALAAHLHDLGVRTLRSGAFREMLGDCD